MLCQSPATPVLAPSSLVSPPAESSRYDVKKIGCAPVPLAVSVPFTVSPCPLYHFTTWPGTIVSAPVEEIVKLPLICTGSPPKLHVRVSEIVPPSSNTPLIELAVADSAE